MYNVKEFGKYRQYKEKRDKYYHDMIELCMVIDNLLEADDISSQKHQYTNGNAIYTLFYQGLFDGFTRSDDKKNNIRLFIVDMVDKYDGIKELEEFIVSKIKLYANNVYKQNEEAMFCDSKVKNKAIKVLKKNGLKSFYGKFNKEDKKEKLYVFFKEISNMLKIEIQYLESEIENENITYKKRK